MKDSLIANGITEDLFFPAAVWYFDIAECFEINRSCIENIYRLKETDRCGELQSNQIGWQSRHNLQTTEWIQPLLAIFKEKGQVLALSCGFKSDVKLDCWANVNPKYAYNRLHVHPGCTLSGAYYLQAGEEAGKMSFVDTRFLRQYGTVVNPDCERRYLHTSEVQYTPKIGRCFICPSWMPHYVGQNLGDLDRISVSFNFS